MLKSQTFAQLVDIKPASCLNACADKKWMPVSSYSIVQETKCVDMKTERIAQAVLTKQDQSVTVATGSARPTPRLNLLNATSGVSMF